MSERAITLPIRAVTVFEDRAQVERRGSVELAEGRQVLVVDGVSPLIDVARTDARCTGARLDDVQVTARWVPSTGRDAAEKARLSEALREARRGLDAAEQVQARCEERQSAADALLDQYSGELGRSVWRTTGAEITGWLDGLTQLEAAAQRADDALRGAEAAQRDALRTYERTAAALRRFEDAELEPVGALRLTVHADAATTATLAVRSVVPCAAWRPTHLAVLEGARVTWQTHATVWQNTGEDWADVDLTVSTDRPSAGATLPPLQEDPLSLRDKAQRKRIELAGREVAVSRDDGVAAGGVYDGGEARTYQAQSRVTVRGDGRPHRVATGQFDTAAEVAWVCMPSEAEHVFLRAALRNGDAPLLAGPVTLVRGGAYAGVGDVPYVGPGERFELAFGSDDRLHVIHRRRQVEESRVLGRDRKHFVTEVVLDSTAPEPLELDVVLRMPVSEVSALSIVPSQDHCSEGLPNPDSDGLVTLPVTVKPGERREVRLGFRFETSGDVGLADPW